MQIRFKLSSEDFDILRAYFCPDSISIIDLDNSENCWEDIANASLSYLLKNSLGKSGKPMTVSTSSEIKQLQNVEKLK